MLGQNGWQKMSFIFSPYELTLHCSINNFFFRSPRKCKKACVNGFSSITFYNQHWLAGCYHHVSDISPNGVCRNRSFLPHSPRFKRLICCSFETMDQLSLCFAFILSCFVVIIEISVITKRSFRELILKGKKVQYGYLYGDKGQQLQKLVNGLFTLEIGKKSFLNHQNSIIEINSKKSQDLKWRQDQRNFSFFNHF